MALMKPFLTGCMRAAALAAFTREAGSAKSDVDGPSPPTGFSCPGSGSTCGISTTLTGAGGSTACTAAGASSKLMAGGFCTVAQPPSVDVANRNGSADLRTAGMAADRKAGNHTLGLQALRKVGVIVQAPSTS